MDDDDEIHSPPSPVSGSPLSPRRNGRITVTVAAAPPQQNITLALPIQQPRNGGGGGGGGGGREDCWSEGATGVLIEAWGERYLELSRGNLKQKHWKEVAEIVRSREDYTKTPKTDIQCKNRIDTVKKKYKQEKAKIVAGGGSSNWIFFDRLEHLIGPTAKISTSAAAASPSLQIQKVPMGIPVGIRSANQYQAQTHQQQNQRQKAQVRRRSTVKCESSESDPEASPDSTDSCPPETYERKKPRVQMELNSSARPKIPPPQPAVRGDEWGNSVRELTKAIVKFGETYEEAERSKLQQVVEMEKQRMKFAKEMELQRMEFFMKTQVQISQMKQKRSGNRNNSSK